MPKAEHRLVFDTNTLISAARTGSVGSMITARATSASKNSSRSS